MTCTDIRLSGFVDVSDMYMSGTLWKWTNYFSGWQERWFVLDNGILSYYKSQDDVNNGCKGSVKMSVCDIVVHATDQSRLDLIIPGEQHFYIKASNPKERQEWLVALGSSKAALGHSNEEPENVTQDLMKSKRSELRLYCDLLMQQIHSVKMAVQREGGPDVETLNQVTSLVSPTCDTFIATLDECMKIAQTSLTFEGQHQPITDAALPPSPHKGASKKGKHYQRQNSNERFSGHSRSPSGSSIDGGQPPSRQNSRNRTSDAGIDHSFVEHSIPENKLLNSVTSAASTTNGSSHNVSKPVMGCVQSNTKDSTDKQQKLSKSSETGSVTSTRSLDNVHSDSATSRLETGSLSNCVQGQTGLQADDMVQSDGEVFLDPIEPRIPTFFSEMKHSFMDLKLTEDGGIPVEPFLDACKCLVPIFDKLNATAFTPVKMDFQGNIRKVKTKYSVHPERFTTLQSIILHEIGQKQEHQSSSATMALLWMKRGLEFITGFIDEVQKGEENLSTAASTAYMNSLRPYHGWVVRGVFAVAVKALPTRGTFMSLLSPDSGDLEMVQICVTQDIDSHSTAIRVVIKILEDFLNANNLNYEEQI